MPKKQKPQQKKKKELFPYKIKVGQAFFKEFTLDEEILASFQEILTRDPPVLNFARQLIANQHPNMCPCCDPFVLEDHTQEREQRIVRILKAMEVSFHFKVYLNNFSHYSIIPTILKCDFTNLEVLNLTKNEIISIESLPFLNAQKLKSINLEANQITIFKSLGKTNWSNLSRLSLRGQGYKSSLQQWYEQRWRQNQEDHTEPSFQDYVALLKRCRMICKQKSKNDLEIANLCQDLNSIFKE